MTGIGESQRSRQAAHDQAVRAERRAVAEAAAASLPAPAEQPALLPELAPPAERQGGRPAGASPKATREWVRYLLASYGSPLEELLRIAAMDLDELRRTIGADTRLEAFDRRMQALKEALPYLHQKLPQAIQIEGAPMMAVQIAVSPALAERLAQQPVTIEPDQQVSGEGPA